MITTLDDIKTGDTLLCTDYTSFISKAIVKVMKKWAKKKYGINNPEIVLSHSARFARIAGELYVYGSIDSGYKPWLFKNHYSLNDPNEGIVIQRRKVPLTEEEENKTINYMQHLVAINLMYQYWMFIQFLLLVYCNINIFKKRSDDFTYCYYGEWKCRQNLNPETHTQTPIVDFFMLLNDPEYEIIYKNIK